MADSIYFSIRTLVKSLFICLVYLLYIFMLLLLFLLLQGKVIYHHTMTPAWLKAHASYLHSSATLTGGELKINAFQPPYAAIIKVPLIPAGVFQESCPLTVEITVAHNVDIGNNGESDITYGVYQVCRVSNS